MFLFPGWSAVMLFFVLSGFVLSQGIDTGLRGAVSSYPAFVVKRCFRILPMMWLSVFAGYVVNGHSWHDLSQLRSILDNLTFQSVSLNDPLWSLNVEMCMSLILPAMYVVSSRVGIIGNLCLVYAGIWLIHGNLRLDFVRYALCFQLGIRIPTWGKWLMVSIDRRVSTAAMIVAVIGLFSVLNLSRVFFIDQPGIFVTWTPFMSFVIVAYFTYRTEGRLAEILRRPFWAHVGKVSFSFYVLHWPVLVVVVAAVSHWLTPDVLSARVIFLVFDPPLALLVASVSYAFIEWPFMQWGRKIAASLNRLLVTETASELRRMPRVTPPAST